MPGLSIEAQASLDRKQAFIMCTGSARPFYLIFKM